MTQMGLLGCSPKMPLKHNVEFNGRFLFCFSAQISWYIHRLAFFEATDYTVIIMIFTLKNDFRHHLTHFLTVCCDDCKLGWYFLWYICSKKIIV